MNIEIQSLNRTIDFLVFNHSFSSIAKWQYRKTFRTDRNSSNQIIQCLITDSFGSNITFDPWMLIAVFGLTLTEKNVPVFTLFFETVSALSTVGLSLNFSPLLTTLGKLIIIMTMLVGRIGILTFFTAFVKNYKAQNIAYPKEDISM